MILLLILVIEKYHNLSKLSCGVVACNDDNGVIYQWNLESISLCRLTECLSSRNI